MSRFRGLRRPGLEWLLLRTSSIHTFGMKRPIAAAGLGRDGAVRWSRAVAANRVVFDPACTWILEGPDLPAMPPVGARLTALPIVGGCREP